MKSEKFVFEFSEGYVQVVIRHGKNRFWITWLKCSVENCGLGTKTLKLLKAIGFNPLYASQVIVTSEGFWLKKLKQKLILGFTICHCKKCETFRRTI